MRKLATLWVLLTLQFEHPAGAQQLRVGTPEEPELSAGGTGPVIESLIFRGEPAPDGNGTFLGFGLFPVINSRGQIAFIGGLTGTMNPALDDRGIYLVDTGSVTQLVRAGEAAPDGNGFFQFFATGVGTTERVALNDQGQVAFAATLRETSGQESDSDGLFRASAADGVTQIVRLADPAPDGNGFFGPRDSDPSGDALSPPGLDNAGAVSFHSILNGTSGGENVDDNGVFRLGNATLNQLARAGDPVPGGGDTFGSIDRSLASNLAGQVALQAFLSFGPQPIRGGPPADLERIYVTTDTGLDEVVKTGESMSDGNGILVGLKDLMIAENGDLVFEGMVTGTNDDSDRPHLVWTDGASLEKIARQGQLGPGEIQNPPFEFGEFTGVDFNAGKRVVFSGRLDRNAAPPGNRTSGIYLWEGNVLTRLVRQGDPAPDGNGTFGNVAVPVFMNSSGAIVFSAPLEGTANPPSDDFGIFYIDSGLSVQRIARRGQSLEGSTITSTSFLGDWVGSGGLEGSDIAVAGMNAINDSGQVAFYAFLADGRLGAFLWSSGESVFSDSFESGDTSSWAASIP